jgi:hypothetical protein
VISPIPGWFPAPRRLKAVFHCYFDDSGKESDPSNRFVVIAGYLAVDQVWNNFQDYWGRLLIKHGLPEVHMKEMPKIARQREWSSAKVNAILREFIAVIGAAPGLIGFGVGIDANEYRNISQNRRKSFGDAQEFACSRIIRRVTDRLNDAGRQSEQLAITFDRDFEFARRRLTLFEHVCKRYPDLRESLTQLSFADAKYYYPLQAADLLRGKQDAS